MSELIRHAQTLGLIFSTFLLLVMLLLGVFALWEWWYIAQLARGSPPGRQTRATSRALPL